MVRKTKIRSSSNHSNIGF